MAESINERVERIEKSDPTALTSSAIFREVSALKELIEIRFESNERAVRLLQDVVNKNPTINEVYVEYGERLKTLGTESALNREILETRFDGMDKAIRLLQDGADKFPGRIDEKITSLEKVHSEKFESISKQFAERDVRTQQAAEASTTAVNAALQAQKESAGKQAEAFQEATSKSEQQFTKQIDQQGELLRTEVRGLVAQINELKDRFNRGEGKGEGADKNKADIRTVMGVIIAAAGIAVAIVALLLK